MKNKFLPTFIACLALTGCNSTEPIEDDKPAITYVNSEKEVETNFIKTPSSRAVVSSDLVSVSPDNGYTVYSAAVKAGERYVASFRVTTSGYVAYAFTDANGKLISQYKAFTDNNKENTYYKCSFTVPYGAEKMYINNISSYDDFFEMKQLVIRKTNVKTIRGAINKKEITIAANNTGEYNYTNGNYTRDQYKDHWDKMLSENPYDFFGWSDLVEDYTPSIKTSDLLGQKGTNWLQLPNFGRFLALSSQYKPITSAMVTLPYSVSGKTSKRFVAFRNTFLINNKLTAIYTLHLVAEGHIATTINVNGNTINYLSQQLRQNQFLTLIHDARHYDEAIIMGDFNAQKAIEYQTFVNEGFKIGNGSAEYGEIITLLRDPDGPDASKPSIPADNIIVSSGINYKSFKKLNDYNLNTDHRPVIANLEFTDKEVAETRKEGKKAYTIADVTNTETHTQTQLDFFNCTFSGASPTGLDSNIKGLQELSKPNAISLNWNGAENANYKVLVSENKDMANAIEYTTNTNSIDIFNLKTGTTYYAQVQDAKAIYDYSDVKSFSTNGGIRNLNIDGVTNVRDLGTWKGENNKTIKQGLVYRGGRLNNSYPEGFGLYETDYSKKDVTAAHYEREISAVGQDAFKKLGIKNEIDLRNYDGNGFPGAKEDEVTTQNVRDVNYVSAAMTKTDPLSTSANSASVKKVFEFLANKDNYPVYFHCNIGTNRTGTIAMLLEALCGVFEEDLLKDYMFSNLGTICIAERQYDRKAEVRAETNDVTKANEVIDRLKKATGSSMSEKAISLLGQVGVSRDTCLAIKNILIG